jgi:hypothetical protein
VGDGDLTGDAATNGEEGPLRVRSACVIQQHDLSKCPMIDVSEMSNCLNVQMSKFAIHLRMCDQQQRARAFHHVA